MCLREADEGGAALENFEEEVANKGEMTEAKKEMFTQLKQKQEQPSSKDNKSKRNEVCFNIDIIGLLLDHRLKGVTQES